MIFIVTSVILFVIGTLSLGLALYGGVVAQSVKESIEGGTELRHSAEHRYYLLGMIGMIVLLSRLLAVPVFFWMLQSLLPYCPGAMCAYGVVNIGSPFSDIAVSLKILLPFAYGMWLVVEIGNRREPEIPFTRTLADSFLKVLLPLVAVDSVMDVLTVAAIRPVLAPFCSSVYDVDPPFSPSAILGSEIGWLILMLTIASSILLIVLQWTEVWKPSLQIVSLIVAIAVGVLYLFALHDTYAPLVLGLPTHHCPYCLFQEFPDIALFSALFWIGVASAVWRVILEMNWSRHGLSLVPLSSMITALRKTSSVCVLFSVVSMLSHIALAI